LKQKHLSAILVLILLVSCTPKEEKEKALSSGVQYLGNHEKIVNELENLDIDYKNPTTINVELEDYKLIIIEPTFIEKISKEQLLQALQENFYVFFIDLEDSRIIPEQYFNAIIDDEKKQDKIWTEHLYLDNEQLTSITFSTDSYIEDELLKWLQYFDNYKEDSS
jgi:hypothetical protein